MNMKTQENAETARRETALKVTSVAVTLIILGILTCALVVWLVYLTSGGEPIRTPTPFPLT